jgi:ABC-type sugar transport system permease subunit
MLWTGRVLSALPVLLFAYGIYYGFTHMAEMKQQMVAKYGYPEQTGMPIIVVEIICVVLYVIPQTAVLGAILLTGYLGGATATHVRVSEPWFMPVIVGVVLWLGLFLRDARLRALVPIRRLP